MNVVQSVVATTSTVITGQDLGPGTRGMATVTATFGSPMQNGNLILAAISGDMINAGTTITLGPPPAFIFNIPGGSLSSRTYYIAITFTDSIGRETQIGTIATQAIPANNVVRVGQPNPNTLSSPGWVTWNVYIGTTPGTLTKQNTVPLTPDVYFQEPNTGLITGSNPPTTNIYDTAGLVWNQVVFVNGGQGGTQVGAQAMGFWFANSIAGGDTITFVCAAFNNQPFDSRYCELDIIICELTPGNTNSVLGTNSIQQLNGAGDVKLNLTDSSSIVRTTDYQVQFQTSEAVGVISPSVGTDYFLSLMTGYMPRRDPTTPPLVPPTITGLTYLPVNNVTSYNGLELYFWVTFRTVTVSSGGFYVRES